MAQSGLSCLKTPTTAKYTLSDPVAQFVDSFWRQRLFLYCKNKTVNTLFLWFRLHIQNWCQFNSVLYTASFFYNWHKKINNLWGNFITDQAGVSKMTFPTSIPGRFKSTQYLKSRLQAEGSRSFCSEAHLTLPP